MRKINVTIMTDRRFCNATAAWFKQFDRLLCAKDRSQIVVTGSEYVGEHPERGASLMPLVIIDDRLVPNPTPFEVVRHIRQNLRLKTRAA